MKPQTTKHGKYGNPDHGLSDIGAGYWFLFWLSIAIIGLCSCTKSEIIDPCKNCSIISLKYTREKVYLKTDTLYQDVLCGHWLQVFIDNKKIWDKDTGFVVCDRDLFERRLYIVK